MRKNVIKRYINLICRDLEIEKPSVVFVDTLFTDTQMAMFSASENKIMIKNDVKDYRDVIFAIAHELRHKYQIDNNLYSFKDYKTSIEVDIETYNSQEQEVDAHAYACKYMIIEFEVQPLFNGFSEEVKKLIYERVKEI